MFIGRGTQGSVPPHLFMSFHPGVHSSTKARESMRRGALLASATTFESVREKKGVVGDDAPLTAPLPRRGSRPCGGSSSSVNSAASVTLSCLCALLHPPRGEAWGGGHAVAKSWRNLGGFQQPYLQRGSSALWPCIVRDRHGSSGSPGGFSRRRKRGLIESHDVSISGIADTGSNSNNSSRSSNNSSSNDNDNRLYGGGEAAGPSSSPVHGEAAGSQKARPQPPPPPPPPPPNTAGLNGRRTSASSPKPAPPLLSGATKPAATRRSQSTAGPRDGAALTASSTSNNNIPADNTPPSSATPSAQPEKGKGKGSHAVEHEMRRLGKKRRWKDVLEVLRSIEAPSVGHYVAAIAACDLAGEPKQALRVHGLMIESGAEPSPVRYGE